MLRLIAILGAVALLAAPGLARADAAGTALGVNPAADAAFGGETRVLKVGSDVFIGDLIETGPKGQVQILFADNTELVVGPNSALKIEDYLIRNDGSAGKLAVDMLSGAFRFATGDSAKNRYIINTPTGTIGVRGTNFDTFIGIDGISRILLYHGIVRYCTEDGDCKELTDFCQLGEIGTAETLLIGDTREIEGPARAQLKGEFIYFENQASLLRQFWFTQARDCLNTPPPPVEHPELEDGPDNDPPPKGRGVIFKSY